MDDKFECLAILYNLNFKCNQVGEEGQIKALGA